MVIVSVFICAAVLLDGPTRSVSPMVPDLQRRLVMNVALVGAASVPVGWLGGGFLYFLYPPQGGNAGSGVTALDAFGNAVKASEWVSAHPFPYRALVEGLKGDAHYLIAREDKSLESYAINAVCTHLGCVVPWNVAANKYMCPCHGSQYDYSGKVIRGPAPLSLALARCEVVDDIVRLNSWTDVDFRTGVPPWWR